MYTLADIKEYVRDIDKFYAHIPESGDQSKEPETLLQHLELVISYYNRICKEKGMEQIIFGIIKSMNCSGRKLDDEECRFVYDLFVNAIYMHDIGKINPAFQKEKMKNSFFSKYSSLASNHSLLSALMYIDIFQKNIKAIPDKIIRNYFFNILYSYAYIISKHHGALSNLDNFIDKLDKQKNPRNRKMFDYYTSKSIFDIPTENNGEESPFSARNDYYDKWDMEAIDFYILNKLLYSLIVSCDYYATYHYQNNSDIDLGFIKSPKIFFEKYSQGKLYKSINSSRDYVKKTQADQLSINELRSKMFIEAEEALLNNINSNIFYLEAPTGGGKTNTSINLALNTIMKDTNINNIFYIFPFNTLIDQTAETLLNYFKYEEDFAIVNSVTPIISMHSDKDEEYIDYEKSFLFRQFMHYPIVATSHINFFNALFGTNRENNFILWRLCNSVVIIDEIQSYKNGIWREIIMFFERYAKLLNVKVIIMSATLPRLDKMLGEGIEGFTNLLSDSEEYYQNPCFKNRVNADLSLLDRGKIEIEELCMFVRELFKKNNGGKILVEFIKKSTARQFYAAIKDSFCNRDIVVELTGDDNKFIRKDIINRIKSDKDIIVVATQVIEAGVDIDMDIGLKNISILDGEEQFLGRINRSCKNTQGGRAFFFLMDEPDSIYKGDYRLHITLKEDEAKEFLKAKAFRTYYEKVMMFLMEKTSKSNLRNIDAFKNNAMKLNFDYIFKHMQLIDKRDVQIFLAHEIKLSDGEIIDGKEVWKQYKELIMDKSLAFAQRKVELSNLYEKMAYFTYNVYADAAYRLNDEHLGFYYIDNGVNFIDEDGKFQREKFSQVVEGCCW